MPLTDAALLALQARIARDSRRAHTTAVVCALTWAALCLSVVARGWSLR